MKFHLATLSHRKLNPISGDLKQARLMRCKKSTWARSDCLVTEGEWRLLRKIGLLLSLCGGKFYTWANMVNMCLQNNGISHRRIASTDESQRNPSWMQNKFLVSWLSLWLITAQLRERTDADRHVHRQGKEAYRKRGAVVVALFQGFKVFHHWKGKRGKFTSTCDKCPIR